MNSAVLQPDATPRTTPPIACRILVVEDIPSLQRMLVVMLTKAGHLVQGADDGEQALRHLSGEGFDIVLMDIQMPGMNGLDVIRTIRAGEQAAIRLPIVAITAHALPGDAQACYEAGADAYLRKPVDFAELLGLIQRLTRAAGRDDTAGSDPDELHPARI